MTGRRPGRSRGHRWRALEAGWPLVRGPERARAASADGDASGAEPRAHRPVHRPRPRVRVRHGPGVGAEAQGAGAGRRRSVLGRRTSSTARSRWWNRATRCWRWPRPGDAAAMSERCCAGCATTTASTWWSSPTTRDRARRPRLHAVPPACPEWLSPIVSIVPGAALRLPPDARQGPRHRNPRWISKVTLTT